MYWYSTKQVTYLSTFENEINVLSDGGTGHKSVYDIIDTQIYVSWLTPAEAEQVKEQLFVQILAPMSSADCDV